ncbi:MAG: hypothetical protein IT364_03430 [Candidatus Hydrogenedentes bacterium]|nr:hypothetical protein [Candidatus Hydrogenedentota bacterium]
MSHAVSLGGDVTYLKPDGRAGSRISDMKPYVRSILTAIAVSGLVVFFSIKVVAPSVPPVVGRPDVEEVRQFTQSALPRLRLENADGLVRISTHAGTEVKGQAVVRAFLRGAAEEPLLREYVNGLVQVSEHEGTLVVVTEPSERPDGCELFVVYDVSVPSGTDVDIESNNGNVWVEAGCGRVQVKGRNTDIQVRRPQKDVVAESINGRITVYDAPDGGSLKTVNGNVYADVKGGRLEAATANGNVVARVLGPEVAGAALTSQNGGVTLEMDEGCSATILARTARGSVETELPVDVAAGARHRGYLQGTVGTGGNAATITMDTLNGDISIARSSS